MLIVKAGIRAFNNISKLTKQVMTPKDTLIPYQIKQVQLNKFVRFNFFQWNNNEKQHQVKEQIQEMYKDYEQAMESNSNDNAIDCLQKIIGLQCNLFSFLYYPTETIETQNEISPEYIEQRLSLATHLYDQNQYQEASQMYEKLKDDLYSKIIKSTEIQHFPKNYTQYFICLKVEMINPILMSIYLQLGEFESIPELVDEFKVAIDSIHNYELDNFEKLRKIPEINILDQLEIEGHYQQMLGDFYSYLAQLKYRNMEIQETITYYEKSLEHRQQAKLRYQELIKSDTYLNGEDSYRMIVDQGYINICSRIASSLESLGTMKFDIREEKEAQEFLLQALDIYNQYLGMKSMEYINCLHIYAQTFLSLLDYKQGNEQLEKCLELLGEPNNINISVLNYQLNAKNDDLYNQALALEQVGIQFNQYNWYTAAEIGWLKSQALINLGRSWEAMENSYNVIEMLDEHHIKTEDMRIKLILQYSLTVSQQLARQQLEPNNARIEQAINLLLEAIEIQQYAYGDVDESLAEAYYTLGQINIRLDNKDQGIQYIEKAISIAKQIPNMVEIVDAYLSELSAIKLKLGNKQEAIELINQAIEQRQLTIQKLGKTEDHILKLYQKFLQENTQDNKDKDTK